MNNTEDHEISWYLTGGFVRDSEASSYLRRVHADVLTATHGCDVSPSDLLAQIVEETIGGAKEIVIPLTAGYDSRALLGACLKIVSAQSIHAFTFGEGNTWDCRVASRLSRKLGLRFTRLDPVTVKWDRDEIVALDREVIKRAPGRARIDGLWITHSLSKLMPSGLPVLSGYLGDMTSGAHLPKTVSGDSRTDIELFMAVNDLAPPTSIKTISRSIKEYLLKFIAEFEPVLKDFPGFDSFDLLDLTFRQRLRMRSGVAGAYERAILPFEDPRWIAQWAMTPIEDRRRQRKYKEFLRKSYPPVFWDLVWGMPKNPILPKLIDRGLGVFGRSMVSQINERGDPRTNNSFERTLRELIRASDKRALIPSHRFENDLNMYLKKPTHTGWKRILSSASAEAHLVSACGLSGSGYAANSSMVSQVRGIS